MGTYILRRLLLMIPTLIGITIVVFSTMALSPGGIAPPIDEMQGMRPEEQAAVKAYYQQRYGLGDPLPLQYLRWLNNVSPIGVFNPGEDSGLGVPVWPSGSEPTADAPAEANQGQARAGPWWRFGLKAPDLGRSFHLERQVTDIVASALPITLALNLLSIPLAYAVAISTGIYAARYRGQFFDVASGTVLLALWSIPVMWAGVMLIGFLASKEYLHLFPTAGLTSTGSESWPFLPWYDQDGQWQRGYLLDFLWHLILPVICLTYGGFAVLSKLMRASILESLAEDFVRTARAKGVDSQTILFGHVLRNSLLPLITVAASLLPSLLGGSIIVEQIFSIQGMGRTMIEAINQRDRDVVLSITFVVSIVSLLSLILRDVCYAWADPRITYE